MPSGRQGLSFEIQEAVSELCIGSMRPTQLLPDAMLKGR
jgi:hypothetical protein